MPQPGNVRFTPTTIAGLWLIDLEKREDDRGWFARSWCAREFQEHGLNPVLVQCNFSFNRWTGTLRGMHYQSAPHLEAKLVQCSQGAIYDVALDLRRDSPTFKQWFAAELSADNRRMLFIPEGLAHGFQTLSDDTMVFYQMSEYFHPECAAGVRWNDPGFQIRWPETERRIIAAKDEAFPDFQ